MSGEAGLRGGRREEEEETENLKRVPCPAQSLIRGQISQF